MNVVTTDPRCPSKLLREWRFLLFSMLLVALAWGRWESRNLGSDGEDFFGAPPVVVHFEEELPLTPVSSPRLVPSALT